MILHILNGDSTLDIMQNLDIKGEFSVWREVMCEGPVHGDLQSTAFWESVLAGEERFLSSQIYIGGAKHTAYYWNGERICVAA